MKNALDTKLSRVLIDGGHVRLGAATASLDATVSYLRAIIDAERSTETARCIRVLEAMRAATDNTAARWTLATAIARLRDPNDSIEHSKEINE